MSLSVAMDTAEFDKMVAGLRKPELDKAVAMALADTQRNTKTKAASAIAKHMGAKSAGVKEAIDLPFVAVGQYQADIKASKRPIPLINFKVRQTAKGVSTTAWGKTTQIHGAFIATMKSGHRGVYRRTSSHRTPIKELWGPTVLGTFVTPEVAAIIQETMKKRIAYNLARRVRAQMRKGGGK